MDSLRVLDPSLGEVRPLHVASPLCANKKVGRCPEEVPEEEPAEEEPAEEEPAEEEPAEEVDVRSYTKHR